MVLPRLILILCMYVYMYVFVAYVFHVCMYVCMICKYFMLRTMIWEAQRENYFNLILFYFASQFVLLLVNYIFILGPVVY